MCLVFLPMVVDLLKTCEEGVGSKTAPASSVVFMKQDHRWLNLDPKSLRIHSRAPLFLGGRQRATGIPNQSPPSSSNRGQGQVPVVDRMDDLKAWFKQAVSHPLGPRRHTMYPQRLSSPKSSPRT